ncbi:MAG: fructosamine kinase family protein [Nocardioidaceae bacterium]|nr:fructosamine kinase family protein [Nocardioidaceae bacterium]
MARMGAVAARAEKLLGVSVVATTPVAGGDVCTATRLRLTDGRSAVMKTRPHAPAGFFPREAEGLRWLAEAGGAPVPEVLGVADDCLVLAWVEPGRPSSDAAERLGRDLARTHAAGAPTFGGEQDGWIGLAPLPNQGAPTWAEFFVSRRVMPYVKAAYDRAAITQEEAAAVERLMRRLPEFAGPPEPVARVHGDLWGGNVVWGQDGAAHLIDPAAHGGHRETDLAMLALFGSPHLQRVLESYDEAAPLADGWRARVPIHQLHPLLVHAVMFGGGYGARAAAAARSVLDGTAGA